MSNSPRSQPAMTSIAPLTSAYAAISESSSPALELGGLLIIAAIARAIARALSRLACCRTSEVCERRRSCTSLGSEVRKSSAATAVAWTWARMSGAAFWLTALTASRPLAVAILDNRFNHRIGVGEVLVKVSIVEPSASTYRSF